MADPSLTSLLASARWINGIRKDPVLGDVPPVATRGGDGAAGMPEPPPPPGARPKPKSKAAPLDDEAMARILASVLYSPTPAATVDTSSGAVPVAKLGLNMTRQPEGYPIAIDTNKLQPGDLAVLSAFLAKQKGGGKR